MINGLERQLSRVFDRGLTKWGLEAQSFWCNRIFHLTTFIYVSTHDLTSSKSTHQAILELNRGSDKTMLEYMKLPLPVMNCLVCSSLATTRMQRLIQNRSEGSREKYAPTEYTQQVIATPRAALIRVFKYSQVECKCDMPVADNFYPTEEFDGAKCQLRIRVLDT